tara:strand:- start:175 stop:336 length:162 start_codon:yes stop_codon:yes gene_type:complete
MIELLLATALSCAEAEDLISNIQKSQVVEKVDLIEVVKANTEPKCYEGSESST